MNLKIISTIKLLLIMVVFINLGATCAVYLLLSGLMANLEI